MPVGCLGGGSASNNGGFAKPMDVIVTSTVLNAADANFHSVSDCFQHF